MEAMFQLRIDTVTVVKEISQISVVNKYSKAPDSGEAREVYLSSHVAACPHVLKISLGRKSEHCLNPKLRRSIKRQTMNFQVKRFSLLGKGWMGGEGCFAHKGIYSLDFEILIGFALSNLTIAVKFLTERKTR